jgi:hypothetical protein
MNTARIMISYFQTIARFIVNLLQFAIGLLNPFKSEEIVTRTTIHYYATFFSISIIWNFIISKTNYNTHNTFLHLHLFRPISNSGIAFFFLSILATVECISF